MKFAKLFLVVLAWFIATLALTWIWFHKIADNAGPGRGIDIVYVVTRPLYLLEFLAIGVLAGFACWRWVFA